MDQSGGSRSQEPGGTDAGPSSGRHGNLRASAPVAVNSDQLGPLADLPGTWMGGGFNLISLPDKQDGKPFRLKLSATREFLIFDRIGAQVPDRGSAQNDIFLFGLTYLQRVTDAATNAALHVEPGIWLNVPPTTDPAGPASVVRQGTIPHGDSLLAQGTSLVVKGGPVIVPVSPTPTGPGVDPAYLAPFNTTAVPPGFDIKNPNAAPVAAISGQKIINTVVLSISTVPSGGILNIPFVVKNANATKLDAIFWIETVEQPDKTTFLQLQYTQTVTLNFLGIDWPHISVATLVKQ